MHRILYKTFCPDLTRVELCRMMGKIKECLTNEKEIKIMKKIILITLVCVFLAILTSCGIKNNDPDLVADLSKQDLHLQEKLNVKSVEIVKRNTDKENKKDEIYVRAIANGFGVECDMQYKLVYNYYTDGGWILDECIPEKTNDWKVTPTTGVDSEEIDGLKTHIIHYGNDYEDFYTSVNFLSQKTFLNDQKLELNFEVEQRMSYRFLKAKYTCAYEFCSGYSDSGLWWFWDRAFYDDKYEIIEQNYDVMCGEWVREGFEHSKYEIVKAEGNQYKLICQPYAYSTSGYEDYFGNEHISFEATFNVQNNRVFINSFSYITDFGMETKTAEEIAKSNGSVNITLNDDGSIHLFQGIAPYCSNDVTLKKK